MPDWIAKIDRIDKMLSSEGVPDRYRMRMVTGLADAFAQADKARWEANSAIREAHTAARLHDALGATRAASECGVCRSTIYNRRKKCLTGQKNRLDTRA